MKRSDEDDRLVERSIRRYRRAHRGYDRSHPEIFNEVEQKRLRAALERATAAAPGARALDFGCGSGNLTGHLVDLGLEVTAADVSPHFLRAVASRFGVRTLRLNGRDLEGVPDASFDLVAAYSVLHHIPDYLAAVRELARVTAPGGIVYIDHEANDGFWAPDGCAHLMREEWRARRLADGRLWNPERRRWQRYLMPSKYVLAVRLKLDPDYLLGSEGTSTCGPRTESNGTGSSTRWRRPAARSSGGRTTSTTTPSTPRTSTSPTATAAAPT